MTLTQAYRIYRKLWAHVTQGDGYQPWGHDAITMRINHPGFFPAVVRIKAMIQ